MQTNQTRAYIVHMTDDARHSLSAYDFTFTPRETFKAAQPLDIDALRIVLESLKRWERTESGTCEEVEDAIAKLEPLIK